jgi:hypothetical protein
VEEEVWGGLGPNWAVQPYDDDDDDDDDNDVNLCIKGLFLFFVL